MTFDVSKFTFFETQCRCGNFGGSLVCNMVLIYLPESADIYVSRGGKFIWIGSV